MQSIGKTLFIMILLVFAVLTGFANDGKTVDNSEKWYGPVHSVMNILKGRVGGQTTVKLAPGAQLTIGGTLVSLSSVVEGKDKTHSLLEQSEKNPVSLRLKVNDAEDAAYLILGTHPDPGKTSRYHTVVFMKDSVGDWLIEAWHASH